MDISALIQRLYKRPEVKALEDTKDDNPYHAEPSVMHHTKSVESEITKYLEENKTDYLSEKIGRYTRAELLRITAVLHDIGKSMHYIDDENKLVPVLTRKENGDTTCKKHPEVGAAVAYEILIDEGLSDEEASYVADVIHNHMRIHHLLQALEETKRVTRAVNRTRNKLNDFYLDVLMHTRADLAGSEHRADYKENFITLDESTFTEIEFIDYLILKNKN